MCGLISAVANGQDAAAFLRTCEAHADASPYPEGLREWAAHAAGIFALDEKAAYAAASRGENRSDRVIASLALLSRPALDPQSLWAGLYVPLVFLNGVFWGIDVATQLDGLGGRLWRRASENRFAFRSPTLFLPDLKVLCSEQPTGMKRLANILLTILPAMDLNPDPDILALLKRMAKGEVTHTWQNAAPAMR